MNRINKLFQKKKKNILSIYYCAGYPTLESTTTMLESLETNGVDLVEIGIPFSDPLADGKTIQQAAKIALQNGMTLRLLFEQLKDIRNSIQIPLVLMGYFNPILTLGFETFCKKCDECGIDGIIIPDLPYDFYKQHFKKIITSYKVEIIPLISPETDVNRIQEIDNETNSFLYVVSSNAITGAQPNFTPEQVYYFSSIKELNLKNPHLIGFGISNYQTAQKALNNANGIIIGSKFINLLNTHNDASLAIQKLKEELYNK